MPKLLPAGFDVVAPKRFVPPVVCCCCCWGGLGSVQVEFFAVAADQSRLVPLLLLKLEGCGGGGCAGLSGMEPMLVLG